MADKTPQTDTPQEQEDVIRGDAPVRPQRRQSVAIYLIILFAAAFLLLLMAYFMQQRNSNVIIGNLQDSLTSFQAVDELREENQRLQEQLQTLEDELADLQERQTQLEQQYNDAIEAQQQAQAEADLRQALSAAQYHYEQGDYQAAAQALSNLGDAELAALSDRSEDGAPSDALRYETLRDALLDAGFLTQDESGRLQPVGQD